MTEQIPSADKLPPNSKTALFPTQPAKPGPTNKLNYKQVTQSMTPITLVLTPANQTCHNLLDTGLSIHATSDVLEKKSKTKPFPTKSPPIT